MLYLYKDEKTIVPYNGDNIKIYVGNILNTFITNPTDEQLKMVGYMELLTAEYPNYNPEKEYAELSYKVQDNQIYEFYEIKGMEENEYEE